MCGVPFGETAVCQAGVSFTQPQSNCTVPPMFGSRTSWSSPRSPAISFASSTIASDGRAGALGDVDRVADVVGVAVGEEDVRRVDVAGLLRRLRVPGEERVDEHAHVPLLDQEARVAQEGDLRHLQVPSRCRISSWASSSPTATPTSIPSPASSSTSARTAASRSAGSSIAAARPSSASWAEPNQPPSASAAFRTRWRPGRGVGDDLLRVREALGLAERADGGVDLFGRVGGALGHDAG